MVQWRRFFGSISVFKEYSEEESNYTCTPPPLSPPSPRLSADRRLVASRPLALHRSASPVIHVFFTLIFSTLLIIYSIVAFIDHFDRPFVDTFSFVPSTDLPPLDIGLTIACVRRRPSLPSPLPSFPFRAMWLWPYDGLAAARAHRHCVGRRLEPPMLEN